MSTGQNWAKRCSDAWRSSHGSARASITDNTEISGSCAGVEPNQQSSCPYLAAIAHPTRRPGRGGPAPAFPACQRLYPPDCYSPLLRNLGRDYHVFGMLLRPLWPGADPQSISDWSPFSNDLLRFLEQEQASKVLGVGHSIGAVVTLRAALQQPERFEALVLLDPVLLPRTSMLQLRILRKLGLVRRLNDRVEGALRRRRRFDDLEQLFAGYRRRDIFRFFSDEHLRVLIEGITRPDGRGGYELTYSPEWEARIYQTGWHDLDTWADLRRLNIPTLIVRGAQTDTFRASTGQKMQSRNAEIRVMTIPNATHLVPMERPDEVAEAIREFVEKA